MKLNLKRPLAFFDLETTGVMIGIDRIVEISILKIHPDGTEEIKTHRINPEMPIPLASSLVHGIPEHEELDGLNNVIKRIPKFGQLIENLQAELEAEELAKLSKIDLLKKQFIIN